MSGPSLFTMAMMSLRGVVSSESEVQKGPAATTAVNPGHNNVGYDLLTVHEY